jgi:protein TonB
MTKQRTEHEQESRRRLRQGFLWSLVAHVLVLGVGLSLPRWQDTGGTALTDSRLEARLQRSATSTPDSLPVEPTRKPKAVPPRLLASASTRTVSAVPPAPTFSVLPSVEFKRSVDTALPDLNAVTNVGPDTTGLDANALRGYRLALAIEARRFKRVPDQALAEGWAGTADVRLAVAVGGQAIRAELAKSSGYAALDTAALSMIEAAAQRAVVPPLLQQRAFVLTLPVAFTPVE